MNGRGIDGDAAPEPRNWLVGPAGIFGSKYLGELAGTHWHPLQPAITPNIAHRGVNCIPATPGAFSPDERKLKIALKALFCMEFQWWAVLGLNQ